VTIFGVEDVGRNLCGRTVREQVTWKLNRAVGAKRIVASVEL